MVKLSDAEIKELVNAYAGKWHRRFTAEGLTIELDDIKGELSLALSRAIPKYNPEDYDVKFTTYAITAMNNSMFKLRVKMLKNEINLPMVSYVEDFNYQTCMPDEHEDNLNSCVGIAKMISRTNGIDRIVALELMFPSSQTCKMAEAYRARESMLPNRRRSNRYSDIGNAIMTIHNLSLRELWCAIKRIRKKIKEDIAIYNIKY